MPRPDLEKIATQVSQEFFCDPETAEQLYPYLLPVLVDNIVQPYLGIIARFRTIAPRIQGGPWHFHLFYKGQISSYRASVRYGQSYKILRFSVQDGWVLVTQLEGFFWRNRFDRPYQFIEPPTSPEECQLLIFKLLLNRMHEADREWRCMDWFPSPTPMIQ